MESTILAPVDPTVRRPPQRAGMTPRDILDHTYTMLDNELAEMTLRINSPRTTKATEDDALLWESGIPGAVEEIRASPEWKLWLKVIRGIRPPPGTSERSCLPPAYEGYYEENNAQRAGSPPVPFADEHAIRVSRQRFGGGLGTAGAHEVLVIVTGRN